MKVVLIAPTINELEGLRLTFPRLDKTIIDEIIVADKNSTDGTIEYCKENGYRIYHQQSRGYGAAVMEVIAMTDADVIVEFCADGSSIPEKVSDLLAKINEGYDLAVASRYKDGAKSYDDDLVTRIGNWFFTKLINILFRARYTDTLVGFRAYRRSAYNSIRMSTPAFAWTAQQSIQFAKAGLKVAEIGADEPARVGSKRKMSPVKAGSEILKVIFKEFLAGKKFADA